MFGEPSIELDILRLRLPFFSLVFFIIRSAIAKSIRIEKAARQKVVFPAALPPHVRKSSKKRVTEVESRRVVTTTSARQMTESRPSSTLVIHLSRTIRDISRAPHTYDDASAKQDFNLRPSSAQTNGDGALPGRRNALPSFPSSRTTTALSFCLISIIVCSITKEKRPSQGDGGNTWNGYGRRSRPEDYNKSGQVNSRTACSAPLYDSH